MKNLDKLRIYIRGTAYCYMDHKEDYNDWKVSRYQSIFNPLFVTLIADPKIIRSPEDKGVYFMVLETDKEVMIIFPGTRKSFEGLKDFNFDFQMTPESTQIFGEPVQIHSGFFQRYISLRAIVQEFLSRLDGLKKVTFIGHSLGASMAVMAALDGKTRKRNLKSKCVTFGMPKFTCDAFYRIYSKSGIGIITVKKQHDPICHPFFVPFTIYKYLGTELVISQNDDTWVRVLIATILSIPLLPFSSILVKFFHMLVVSLYGMKLTHSTSTYVKQVDEFVASSPRLYKKIPKFNQSTSQSTSTSDLSSVDRVKCTVQDAALILPIILMSFISFVQFCIFTVGASLQKLVTCFQKFRTICQ